MSTQAKIQLKLYATLRDYAPPDGEDCDIEAGASIHTLLNRLGIPHKEAKLIFVNGIKGSLDTPLKDGDRLGIFPPVGGG